LRLENRSLPRPGQGNLCLEQTGEAHVGGLPAFEDAGNDRRGEEDESDTPFALRSIPTTRASLLSGRRACPTGGRTFDFEG